MESAHAFAVAEGGAIIGERDAGAVVPWWSFTKTVIAAAALTLVRDGKLDLDEPMQSKPLTLRPVYCRPYRTWPRQRALRVSAL